MRLALLLVRNCSLSVANSLQLSITGRLGHAFTSQGLFFFSPSLSLSPFSLFTCRSASFSNVVAVLFIHVDLVEPTFSTRDSGLCRPYGKSESNRQKIAHLADIWPTPRLITIHDQMYAL